jgi:hypothetical protein
MKKIKLFLIGAAILGSASAFIPAADGDPYVLVDGNFIPKDPNMGSCVNGGTICTYTLLPAEERENIDPPYSAADFSSNPLEHKTWVPN